MISFSCRLFRARFALDVDFSADDGCVALFGPSGSGKTTVTRLIAGLQRPDHGRISIGEHVLVDTAAGIWVPVHKRRVGLVFQDGQILPHLSVRQNLEYGRSFAPSVDQIITRDAAVELLGIGHLLSARPATLSGGERQRVAIGRALLAAPRVLVMDEPLASLDVERKYEILPFVERLRDELRLPIVYVSHAVEEVARLATTVVRLDQGRVIAQGTPAEVFTASARVAGGDRFEVASVLSGDVRRALEDYGMTILSHPAGEIVIPGLYPQSKGSLRVTIPATNVTLALERPRGLSVRTALEGRVQKIAPRDEATVIVTVELKGGDTIMAFVTRLAAAELGLEEGREIVALVKAASIDDRTVARRVAE